eukprot:gene8573-10546_t
MATTEGVEYAQAVAAGMQRFTGRRGGEDKTYLKLDMVTDGCFCIDSNGVCTPWENWSMRSQPTVTLTCKGGVAALKSAGQSRPAFMRALATRQFSVSGSKSVLQVFGPALRAASLQTARGAVSPTAPLRPRSSTMPANVSSGVGNGGGAVSDGGRVRERKWVPDSERSGCVECGSKFTLF